MESDSQNNDSQSDFNHLNKLNPDESQQSSQTIPNPNPQQKPQIPNRSHQQQPNPKPSNPSLIQLIKPVEVIPIPKKQLNLVKENKPRLIIDHMILHNFKSYAGTLKIGPFHKNFTSIVGPNGSGKSNLIESMLFIFGFNASWMRLNKLHQLIHNSSSLKNVGSASVQVHFKKILDNHDGSTTQLTDSQFFIRRSVNTSSVSKYYLNGNDSTALQIKTKLKSQGIDLTNNRFLILQGQVEQISQMKQKSGDPDKPGFLEYLQEIIGSNQFIERIEKAAAQYNDNEQKKHERGERMKIVENQLKGMNSQKQQAIRFVKRQRKIFQLESILQQVIRSNSAYALRKVQQKLADLQRRRQQIIKEEKQKLAKQGERVTQIKKIKAEKEKVQREKQIDDAKFQELQAEDRNLKNQIAYNSEDQVKYEKKLDEIKAEFTKIINESEAIKKGLPDKQKQLEDDHKELQQLRQKLSKHDKPELRQKIKNLQNQLKGTNLQKATFQSKQKTLTQQIQRQNHHQHQHKCAQYKSKIQQHAQLKAKMQIALEIATKEYKEAQQTYQQQTIERNKLRHQAEAIENMIRQRQSHKSEQGQLNNMFNYVMKCNIPGVLGRLGDLGDIPKNFDDVMTTACSRLDNFVVQNFEASQKVLSILKQNQLGRATCILLENIQDQAMYMARPFHVPENTVRLFDLVKVSKQEVKSAFFYAYSNTLYCENLDQALAVSTGENNNRRRVIARKGHNFALYEMNGTINSVPARRGGFQKKAAQNRKNNEAEDRELVQRHQQISKEIQTKSQILRNIENRLKQYQSNIQTLKAQKVTQEIKIKQVRDELVDLERLIERNKGRKREIQNMQRQVDAIQQQLMKLGNHIQKLTKSLQDVQNQQKKFETPEVTTMRQRFKNLRQEYSKLEKQVEKETNLLTTVEKRIKENKSKRDATEKQIERLQQMIAKNQADIKKVENMAIERMQNKKKCEARILELNAKEDEIKVILSQDELEVRKSKEKIEEAKSQCENARREERNAMENHKFAESELERIRKLYKEMTSTYDFLNEIDQIEKMNIQSQPSQNSSMMDVTLQNVSLQMSMDQSRRNSTGKKMGNEPKVLDMKRIQKMRPQDDLSEDQLDAFLLFQQKIRAVLSIQSTQLKKMQGKNTQIISEYKAKFLDYKQKLNEFNEIKEKQHMLKCQINKLKEERFNMFRSGFAMINSKLKEVYQLLTNGGDAQLELIDALDPFSDGVNFSVRPPKKAWKEINKLSGGQKTLSSLSLIFALHYYKPTPLYFMDEIDAALDFKNVSIVGDYIKKRTKDAQFIIISLRNNMFDLADKLVGVYKTFDQTKVINLAAGKLLAKRQITSEQQKKQKQKQPMNLPPITEI